MSFAQHLHDDAYIERHAGTLWICSRPLTSGRREPVSQAVIEKDFHAAAAYIVNHGHSWIEYQDTTGGRMTWGTWPELGLQQGHELHARRSQERDKIFWRGRDITPAQAEKLEAFVSRIKSLGGAAYSETTHTCSDFAAACWASVTRESLNCRAVVPGIFRRSYTALAAAQEISNPTSLAYSIEGANQRTMERARARAEVERKYER